MKKQIIIIRGGNSHESYEDYISFLKKYEIDPERIGSKGWKSKLAEDLENEFEVIPFRMPCPMNAKYYEWKIMFDKLLPFLRDDVSLIGHSLGGIFLAKYLSENDFPKRIKAIFLVSAPFDEETTEESLGDFNLPDNLEMLESQGGEIFFYHSEDDPCVSIQDLEKYRKSLPKANYRVFKDRGHFSGSDFNELLEDIRKISNK